ncbi:uncharacterized protein CLUP02_07713 [Colletotrichum lupini]|uniref:Secreted protein n=1 Tax=Colletotrichum lupini TaxID=145971 RepID=A0A9Q8SSX4_9PEZI|nr:uncharacterized protein CLUP02_07713 [Colletotrichum lupini]UQC82226.1 hypothetical protein CLUP02_07713 [Colletotrichum lupini]
MLKIGVGQVALAVAVALLAACLVPHHGHILSNRAGYVSSRTGCPGVHGRMAVCHTNYCIYLLSGYLPLPFPTASSCFPVKSFVKRPVLPCFSWVCCLLTQGPLNRLLMTLRAPVFLCPCPRLYKNLPQLHRTPS